MVAGSAWPEHSQTFYVKMTSGNNSPGSNSEPAVTVHEFCCASYMTVHGQVVIQTQAKLLSLTTLQPPTQGYSHQHRATATNIGKQQACCGHFPHVRTTSSCMTYQVLSSPHQGSNLCDKASVDFPTSGQLPAVVICAMWPVLISQCQDNLQLS